MLDNHLFLGNNLIIEWNEQAEHKNHKNKIKTVQCQIERLCFKLNYGIFPPDEAYDYCDEDNRQAETSDWLKSLS